MDSLTILSKALLDLDRVEADGVYRTKELLKFAGGYARIGTEILFYEVKKWARVFVLQAT